MDGKETNMLKLSVSGIPIDRWSRIQETFFGIIDKLEKKLEDNEVLDRSSIDSTSSMLKDITAIATQWAKSKVEKPSLENEKIKAEIAQKFAETKKTLNEAEKTREETKSIQIDNKQKELTFYIDSLERIFVLMEKFNDAQFLFVKDEESAKLFFQQKPKL